MNLLIVLINGIFVKKLVYETFRHSTILSVVLFLFKRTHIFVLGLSLVTYECVGFLLIISSISQLKHYFHIFQMIPNKRRRYKVQLHSSVLKCTQFQHIRTMISIIFENFVKISVFFTLLSCTAPHTPQSMLE